MTKVYMRNPKEYIDQAIEAGCKSFSWDIGSFTRRNLDPLKFLKTRMGGSSSWELLTIAVEGASLYTNTSTDIDTPYAVYPCWLPEQGFEDLEDLCERPVSEDEMFLKRKDIPPRFRPVRGQDHIVVIYDIPKSYRTAEGRNWFLQLRAVIAKYPNVKFIIHGTRSFRIMFCGDFHAALFNPWWSARNGELALPNGRYVQLTEARKDINWLNLLSFSLSRMSTREDICAYNIQSIWWASKNFLKAVDFKLRVLGDVPDVDSPEYEYELRAARGGLFTRNTQELAFQPGDGVLCDGCSLVNVCKFYREGAVCGVTSTDAGKLGELMGSRDAELIIDGLSRIAELQAKRVTADIEEEGDTGKRLPETDKRLKDLFDSGIKIAKLVKPELNGRGVQVNVGVVGGAPMISTSTPQELIAHAVRALESRGVPRENITNEAIMGLLEGVSARNGAERLEEVIDAELIEDGYNG